MRASEAASQDGVGKRSVQKCPLVHITIRTLVSKDYSYVKHANLL